MPQYYYWSFKFMFELNLNFPSNRKSTALGNQYAKETVYISPIISRICISVIELGLLLKILKNYIFQISFFQI